MNPSAADDPLEPAGSPDLPLSPTGELQYLTQHHAPSTPTSRVLVPFHFLDRVIAKIELAALILLVAAMMVLGTGQVVLREIFNTGLPWADPLLRNTVLVTGMVGAMVATQAGRHLNMDAVARLLPPGARRWVDALVNLISAACCTALVWVSLPYIKDEMDASGEAIVGGLLAWHVQLIFPFSFAIMAFRFSLYAIDLVVGGRPRSQQLTVS